MKQVVFALLIALCATSQAEWFQVLSVTSYNKITAIRPNEPNNEITVRIKNLENIEDIQENRNKVLLSSKSAEELANDLLKGQLVQIENLTEDSGIYVGDVYLSYEQIIRGFAKQRMVGGKTVKPEIKKQIMMIATRMFRQLDTTTVIEDDNRIKNALQKATEGKVVFTYETYYDNDYLKCIFVYEALAWFKETGQFLPDGIQKMYLDWVGEYQSAQSLKAKELEVKIRDMALRYELYRDFVFDGK